MNIFFVDRDPVIAAQSLCDKHVVKMVLESAQIMCSALYKHGQTNIPYKPTHKNHPCVVWAAVSRANFNWLSKHAKALCVEYTHRYGKIHKSEAVIDWCITHVFPYVGQPTPPAQAMPDQYKSLCPVKAYRTYYINDKLKNMDCRWSRRTPPEWVLNTNKQIKAVTT